MTNLLPNNMYLILLLPLWIFLIIMGGRFFSVYVHKKIIYSLTLLSSFLGIVLTSVSLVNFTVPVVQNFSFIKINNFANSFQFPLTNLLPYFLFFRQKLLITNFLKFVDKFVCLCLENFSLCCFH